jgi:CysZ protein
MMSIHYVDYAADNNDVSFRELQLRMRARRLDALMFGLPAYLLLTVPVVNLILMPIGVAGGTRFWVEHLR